MKILIANLGSTSFKYRLFSMTDGDASLLAKGGFERVESYAPHIKACLESLQNDGHLTDVSELDAVGFKTVLGKDLSGCVKADEKVLTALDAFSDVAPAHNPAYAEGIKTFAQIMPDTTLVALFETAFYQWVPQGSRHYAIPASWREIGIQRYGFHGASHKNIAERTAQLLGRDDINRATQSLYQTGPLQNVETPLRVISCHLGGSSSVTGILNGVAMGSSMGFSPQSGLPQNNRVGELDSMAIPYAMKHLNLSREAVEQQLSKEGGLLGLSQTSNDLRDVKAAAQSGNASAQLAIDVLIKQIRHWIGAFYFEMGGADAIAFTGGIGENNPDLRAAICEGLEGLGISLDATKNEACQATEAAIHNEHSKTQLIVIPANEELIVAREVFRFVKAHSL